MTEPPWHDLRAKNLQNRQHQVEGIVLHDTAGSGTHNDTLYLANPADDRVVSVDFTVETDGTIWKLNPQLALFCCDHAGRNTEFRDNVDGEVNHATVGIEIVRNAHATAASGYPARQLTSLTSLVRWLLLRFHLTNADITTHALIITDGSRTDPRGFPMQDFLDALLKLETT